MSYLVFYGDQYYPRGGWKDNHKLFDNKEEAMGFASGVSQECLTWAHVVDLATWADISDAKIVSEQWGGA